MAPVQSKMAFVSSCAIGLRSSFRGASTRSLCGIQLKSPTRVAYADSKGTRNVRMSLFTQKETQVTKDNPDGINYTEYDYIPVGQFTPLSNTNWYAAEQIEPGSAEQVDDWTMIMKVKFDILKGNSSPRTLDVEVQVTSFENNSFRIRCNPDGPIRDVSRGPIVEPQLKWIRSQETGCPWMRQTSDGSVKFETRNLCVDIANNFKVTVTRKSDNCIIMQHDEWREGDWQGYKSRGLMFVDRKYGTAIASVRKNYRLDNDRAESFYGAGEVLAEYNGTYFLERTGLAMTNYNYDNFGYAQPGVLPPNVPDEPDYYVPMYFAAPWVIAHGHRGSANQYSYGWFLDNTSQTYMNTGDTAYAGQADLAYMGAQCGPFDQHFIYGPGDGLEDVVKAFSYLMGKEHEGAKLNKRAVMPPKYVFGFFQGVFGAYGLLEENVADEVKPNDNHVVLADVVQKYEDAKVPLEGLAVDIDVQDNLKVFTTKGQFWTKGMVRSERNPDPANKSVFEWAHDKGLVTQTNITCFIKNNDPSYDVFNSIKDQKLYTKNDALSPDIDFGQTPDGPADAYIGHLDYGGGVETTAVFPDWGKQGVAEWWGSNYKNLFEIGLDFVWQDMTVPAMAPHKLGDHVTKSPDYDYISNNPRDQKYNWKSYHPQVLLEDMRYANHGREPFVAQRNIHAYTLCESTRDKGIVGNESSLTKFKRSFIITRGGYIGNQHFGGAWVGDNISSFEYISIMLINVINMNMSCMPVVGADIGGFGATSDDYVNGVASPEMMTRWVQAGCLLPWFRDHYDRWTERKQHGKKYQELYEYGEPYLGIMKSCVELRYRWQDVLYTSMYQNVVDGQPIIKSIMMYNNDKGVTTGQNDHFLMGGYDGYRILCAPVVSQTNNRDVYLPAGSNWYPYNHDQDDQKLKPLQYGGQTLRGYSAGINDIPLFVREGTILPVRYPQDGKNKSINTYSQDDPLVFEVFSMSGGKGMFYLDDGGRTTSAENSSYYSVYEVESENSSVNSGSLTFTQSYHNYEWHTSFYVRVRNVGKISNLCMTLGTNGMTTDLDYVSATDKFDFFEYPEGTYWEDQNSFSVWMKLPAAYMNDPKGARVWIETQNNIVN